MDDEKPMRVQETHKKRDETTTWRPRAEEGTPGLNAVNDNFDGTI